MATEGWWVVVVAIGLVAELGWLYAIRFFWVGWDVFLFFWFLFLFLPE